LLKPRRDIAQPGVSDLAATDAISVDKLDGLIDTDFIDHKAAEWREAQRKCTELMREHQNANQTCLEEAIAQFEHARKADSFS
jgi:hypothetical protein